MIPKFVSRSQARWEARQDAQGHRADLHYVEGWHVIAEANRIFGYDAWDGGRLPATACGAGPRAPITAQPTPPRCASASEPEISRLCGKDQGPGRAGPLPRGKHMNLRLRVPRPTPPSVRSPPLAIPSGLRFTTANRSASVKREMDKAAPAIGPWVLRSASGADEASFDRPSEFAAALRKAMSEAQDIELLFAIWEQNVETVRALNRSLKQGSLPRSGIAPQLVAHLKHCAVALVKPEDRSNGRSDHRESHRIPELPTVQAQRSTRA